MTISNTNREFIDNLINYYISESSSYKQIAEHYVPEIESVADAAFGIITGCIYASFLETYRNQQIQPGLEDMTEFNNMIKSRAAEIKKAIIDPASVGTNYTAHVDTKKNSKKDQYNEQTHNATNQHTVDKKLNKTTDKGTDETTIMGKEDDVPNEQKTSKDTNVKDHNVSTKVSKVKTTHESGFEPNEQKTSKDTNVKDHNASTKVSKVKNIS